LGCKTKPTKVSIRFEKRRKEKEDKREGDWGGEQKSSTSAPEAKIK
jgi:hypothetical protein